MTATRRVFLLLPLALLWLSPAQANVELPNGAFHETVNDLSVKVPGGWVSIDRTWYDPAQSLEQGGKTATLSAPSGSGGSAKLAISGGTADATQGEWHLNRACRAKGSCNVHGHGTRPAPSASAAQELTPVPLTASSASGILMTSFVRTGVAGLGHKRGFLG